MLTSDLGCCGGKHSKNREQVRFSQPRTQHTASLVFRSSWHADFEFRVIQKPRGGSRTKSVPAAAPPPPPNSLTLMAGLVKPLLYMCIVARVLSFSGVSIGSEKR